MIPKKKQSGPSKRFAHVRMAALTLSFVFAAASALVNLTYSVPLIYHLLQEDREVIDARSSTDYFSAHSYRKFDIREERGRFFDKGYVGYHP